MAEESAKKENIEKSEIFESVLDGKYGVKRHELEIKSNALSAKLNKPKGKYITIFAQDVDTYDTDKRKYLIRVVAKALKDLISKEVLKPKYSVLIVGLGNKNITADSLGVCVSDKMLVTRHLQNIENGLAKKLNVLSTVSTSVLGMTGIESFEIVTGIKERINPDLIICVDSLASLTVKRLSSTFQLSNAGIVPGSGTNSIGNKIIDKNTMGTPVIAVGVPLVVYAQNIVEDVIGETAEILKADKQGLNGMDITKKIIPQMLGDMIVTPKDIDKIVENCSEIVAKAITLAVHNNLSIDDVMQLN